MFLRIAVIVTEAYLKKHARQIELVRLKCINIHHLQDRKNAKT